MLSGLLAFTLAAAGPGQASAQQGSGLQMTEQGAVLNFQDAPLRVVVSALAELAGLTVSYSDLPAKTVTLRSPNPVPRAQLRSMLESVVRANGFRLVEEGGLIRVVGEERPREAAPSPAAPRADAPAAAEAGTRLYIHRLRHTRAETLAQTLRELFGLGRRAGETSLPSERDPAGREARRQRLNPPLSTPAAVNPQGPASGTSAPAVSGLSAELRGAVQIVPDPLTNSLLIRADADDYQTIRAAIEELDTRPLQVLIEVLIAEVRRDRQFDLGLTATVRDQVEPRSGVVLGGEIEGGSAGDVALRILGLGGVRADVVLRALAASSNTDILSRPIILVQNNQEARILVGTQRPFVQISRALPTDAAVRDQVIQYRDVGTQLEIKPTVNPDGYVTLNVAQEVSGATTETQFGAPVISTREVQTQLFVKDGHTVVLGGLVDHQRETGNGGIPILKDIPLLGNLFRSSRRRNSVTELFLLLTPHVIRSDDDLDNMTEELKESTDHLRKRIGEQVPLVERAESVRRKREP